MTDNVKIYPLADLLGAEIQGVDLSRTLSEPTIRRIKVAWASHGVLVFRAQAIDDEAHVAFGRLFGRLQTFQQDRSGPAEIFRTSNVDENGLMIPADDERSKMIRLNWIWHIDSCYMERPARAVVLRAITVPPEGGETVFANAAAAYEALSTARRDQIDSLIARHSFEHLVRHEAVPALSETEIGRLPFADHPVVMRGVNGRASLFLSPAYMAFIHGWSLQDSQNLVKYLTQWATNERFTYKHIWKKGDVIMWDNRWTIHRVMPYDIDTYPRAVHGTTILDD